MSARCKTGPVSKADRRRAERLLQDHIVTLTQRALDLALLGDAAALVACLNRAWPVAEPTRDAAAEKQGGA